MADKKISALTPATTPLAGTEVLPIVQSSTTDQVSVANLTAGRAVSAASLTLTSTPLAATSGGTGQSSAFTANGVVYASSTSALATGAGLQFNGTNVGVGTAPSAWGTSWNMVQFNNGGSIGGLAGGYNVIRQNVYGSASGDKYIADGYACDYFQTSGSHTWRVAPSGSAGGTVSLVNAFVLSNAGDATLSTGNLIQGTAAKGINFTANTPAAGMTSQLLNWYEEGTWVPVLSDGTHNATMGVTGTTNGGWYTRIGRQVTATASIYVDNIGSVSGAVRITGLPFAANSALGAYSAVSVGYATGLSITAGQNVGGYVAIGQAYLPLTVWTATTGTSAMTNTQITTGSALILSITYFV